MLSRSALRCALATLVTAIFIFAGSGTSLAAESGDHHVINVGLQLYSFRNQMEKDVPGTLDLVKKMGITDVEVAGLYNLSAAQFHEELEKRGLKASGMHFQWPQFSTQLDKVIADASRESFTSSQSAAIRRTRSPISNFSARLRRRPE